MGLNRPDLSFHKGVCEPFPQYKRENISFLKTTAIDFHLLSSVSFCCLMLLSTMDVFPP